MQSQILQLNKKLPLPSKHDSNNNFHPRECISDGFISNKLTNILFATTDGIVLSGEILDVMSRTKPLNLYTFILVKLVFAYLQLLSIGPYL